MNNKTFLRRAALGAALLVLAVGGGPKGPSPARAGGVAEYQAKAAFLYNFTKFVQWPESAFASKTSPLVIGVLGSDPFGPSLDQAVAGKTAEGHPLKVVRISATGSPQVSKCHILFVCSSEKERVGDLLSNLEGVGVLTVSDLDRFAQKGGMIQFDQDGGRISLVVNVGAAKKGNLVISAKLLQVAKVLK